MLILRKPWDSQPQGSVQAADWIPAGSILFNGATTQVIGADSARTGTINQNVSAGGVGRSSGTTSSRISIGRVWQAQPGAMTWVAQFRALDSSFRYLTGNVDDASNYVEDIIINSGENESVVAGKLAVLLRAEGGLNRLAASTNVVLTVGRVHTLVWQFVSANEYALWLDGQSIPITYRAAAGAVTPNNELSQYPQVLLNRNLRNAFSGGTNVDLLVYARIPALISNPAELSSNPLLLFDPQVILIPVSAGGGVTGTSATTNAADTSSASGTTTVTGTSGTTNAADTGAASGTTTVTGTSATTNAEDVSAASGSVGGPVSGTSATTNADDTGAANGTTTVTGSSATTNAPDTSAASGSAGAVTGTSETTNANDSAIASGTSGTQAEDTHDGYWSKQWEKLRQREKKKRVEEVQDEIQEIEEQIAEVRAVTPPKPKKMVASARDFYAEQSRIVQQLITERQRLIETEEEEFLLLM